MTSGMLGLNPNPKPWTQSLVTRTLQSGTLPNLESSCTEAATKLFKNVAYILLMGLEHWKRRSRRSMHVEHIPTKLFRLLGLLLLKAFRYLGPSPTLKQNRPYDQAASDIAALNPKPET